MSTVVAVNPDPYRNNKLILALGLAAGAGCLMGLGSLYFYRKLSQKTRSCLELKREMSLLRREFQDVKEIVDKLSNGQQRTLSQKQQDNRLNSEPSSENSMEELFYDAEEADDALLVANNAGSSDLFSKVDDILADDSDESRNKAYLLMRQSCDKYRDNWEFLWRYARAIYLYGQTYLNKDESKRKQFCEEAKTIAYKALDLEKNDAEVHKWCALTIGTGTLSDFVSMKQKIQDGYTFKVHIDKALELKPQDPILHHLCGRWCFGVASLTWIERKVAATVFATPPTSSYDEALPHFKIAEQLKPDWIENTLFLAKCYLAQNDVENGVEWLKKANEINNAVSADDIAAKSEVEQLLKKYNR